MRLRGLAFFRPVSQNGSPSVLDSSAGSCVGGNGAVAAESATGAAPIGAALATGATPTPGAGWMLRFIAQARMSLNHRP